MDRGTTVIALTGKGGVGKTSLSAAFVRLLAREKQDARILAIDADPAVGLSFALGVDVQETLDDIRLRVASEVKDGLGDAQDILAEAKFRIFQAMEEQRGFAFLAIGRPEAAGCYCAINTYLRQVIGMLVSDFDYVVIDGEAGIEQINRRVMEKVTHLVLVSDQSRKGLEICKTITQVAAQMTMYDEAGLIINRALDPQKTPFAHLGEVPVISVIGADPWHMENDIEGKSVFDLPEDSALLIGARRALEALHILSGKEGAT